MSGELTAHAATFLQHVTELDAGLAFFERMGRVGLYPDGITSPQDALMVAAAGRRFGFGPLESLQKFHVVKGRVSPSSDLRAGIMMRSPLCLYLRCVVEATQCTYTTARADDPEHEVSVRYTKQDADLAGLWGRGTWAKHPKAMLRARCVSIISRQVYPDLFAGLYDADEIENFDTPAARHKLRGAVGAGAGAVIDAEFVACSATNSALAYGNERDFCAALEAAAIPVAAVAAWRESIGKGALGGLEPYRLNNVALSLLGLADAKTVIERRTDFALWVRPRDNRSFALFLRLLELTPEDVREWVRSVGSDVDDASRTDAQLHDALLKSHRFAAMSAAHMAEVFEVQS